MAASANVCGMQQASRQAGLWRHSYSGACAKTVMVTGDHLGGGA